MAFNVVSGSPAVGTATSGSSVPATALSIQTPVTGDLLIVVVRAPASSAPTITVSGFTAVQASAQPVGPSGTALQWAQMFYRVATGSESSVQASVTNANFGSTTAEAVISYAEFNGFVGTPKLDQENGNSSTSNGTSGATVSGDMTPADTPELVIGSLTAGNTFSSPSADWLVTGMTNVGGASNTYQELAWLGITALTGGQLSWTWSSNRAWAIFGATFYGGPIQGTASIAGTGTITATGTQILSGTASIAGSGAITATGTIVGFHSGTASVLGGFALTAAGTQVISGQASVVASATITATGTITGPSPGPGPSTYPSAYYTKPSITVPHRKTGADGDASYRSKIVRRRGYH